MRHRVAELEGADLDVAVGMCEGDFDPHRPTSERQMLLLDGRRVLAGPQGFATRQYEWCPSRDWSIAGPIIEREEINLSAPFDGGNGRYDDWGALISGVASQIGPSPLIAAMRAYVASKFGDEVELP